MRGTQEDGGLPGGLSFTGADEDLPARRGGWLRRLAWALVLAGVLGAAGAAGTSWLRDADVRTSLDSSTRTWSRALGALTYADDVTAVSAAAAATPAAADRIAADLAALRGAPDPRRRAVAAQLAAERDVLVALAALDGVDRAPLSVWGQAHGRLQVAVEAEAASRSALRAVDERAARRLPELEAVLLTVGATVGDALARDVTQASAELLAELAGADTTADLRRAAQQAAVQREAVLTAREGVPPSDDGAVLDAFAEALDAVAGLERLSPADLSAWPPARGTLDGTLVRVADGGSGDTLAAGSVRAQLPVVLAGLDRVVQRAADAHAAWLPVRAAAEQAQADDDAALATYGQQVQALRASWDRVRQELAALRAGSSTAEVAQAVGLLGDEIASGRSSLAALVVPEGAAASHAELLAFTGSVESSVRTAGQRLAEDGCAACPARQAQGWSELEAVAGNGAAWDDALARWEAAQVTARDEVTARALPPPPDA